MSDLSGWTTVVLASRGLGRGIACAFAEDGAPVVAVARTGPAPGWDELAALRTVDRLFDLSVAGDVFVFDWRLSRCRPAVTPGGERNLHRREVAGLLGQHVLVMIEMF